MDFFRLEERQIKFDPGQCARCVAKFSDPIALGYPEGKRIIISKDVGGKKGTPPNMKKSIDRKTDNKPASTAVESIFNGDGSLIVFNNIFYDSKAKAGTIHAGSPAAIKSIKDTMTLFGSDTRTIVLNRYHQSSRSR